MLRKLGVFERALFLSDLHSPFNVIFVLRLENAPQPRVVRDALEALQRRHALLRARIEQGWFLEQPTPSLDLRILEHQNDGQWLQIVEREMNTRLDPSAALFRATYLFNGEAGELVLTFHHSIIDAASGVNVLDELLQACAGPTDLPALELLPPVEERFPTAFKGWRGLAATLRYATQQMADEVGYRLHVNGKRVPNVHPDGRGFALIMRLPVSLVDALSRRARLEKVTFNSLLNAAQTLALNRVLYEGEQTPMRTFTFADLRPYTDPPTPPEYLANYISMLRYTLQVSGEDELWELAKKLHEKIYGSLKHGDKFIASRMSEPLMKMFVRMKTMRMGASGLNYSGAVPLQTSYGSIQVSGLHGFLSAIDIAPEVSSQACLFQDELLWNFMFWDGDMDREKADKIVAEIRSILEDAVL